MERFMFNECNTRDVCRPGTKNIRACTGFDGGLEVGEAIRSGTLR